jgi:hypothetical protein
MNDEEDFFDVVNKDFMESLKEHIKEMETILTD